jgi:serine/threonine protein kinase
VSEGVGARNASIARLLASSSPPRLGPFRFVAELGEGGFAPVFLAAEEYGGAELRTVALKLFAIDDVGGTTGTIGTRSQARERIVEEARALCRVEHPNVVRFFQLVEEPTGTVLGLAMEHVRGTSLADRLDSELVLPVDATLEIGAAMASALAAVHAAGLVHRDVKPGNVIDAGGVYKLIDFGIAVRSRRVGPEQMRSSARLALAPGVAGSRTGAGATSEGAVVVSVRGGMATQEAALLVSRDTAESERTMHASDEHGAGTDAVAGTMGYIDPACLADGEPADATSDLYALGAMLFECLTGRLPASDGDDAASVMRIRTTIALGFVAPPLVRELVPSVPEGVARLVDSLVTPKRQHRPQRAEWVACELERLRRVQRGLARKLPSEGPFRGLEAFDARHRDVYFGRATDVASALELLRARGLVALVGPSGSGKSSLARAGVLPAVLDGALGAWPPQWTSVAMSPDAYPRAALGHALAPLFGPVHRRNALPDDPDELAAQLARIVETTSVGIVLLVDALEELVTLAPDGERAYLGQFLAALSSRPMPGLRCVVTARRDLLGPLLGEPGLGVALTRAVQLVVPLTASAWADVVDERLAAYDFALEDDAMRGELAHELATIAEAMPLVEFGLARLWDHRDVERRVVPRRGLQAIGGLAGALARHAEATLAALVQANGPSAGNVAASLLLALTTPHGTRAMRTKADLAREIPDPLREQVLTQFERARLVVVEDGRVTLAHEALIARWPRLAAWVQAERRDRETARDVEEAAARWRAEPGPDRLFRGRPLRDARTVSLSRRTLLTPEAQAFIAASRRNELRASAGIVGLASSVFVAAAVLGVVYWESSRESRAAQARAETEKVELAKITQTLIDARNRPASQQQRDIEELLINKRACEKELARCTGDAGTP